MELYIDSANMQVIEELYSRFPCDGVTTNPSILCREQGNPMENLRKIRNFLPKDALLHSQVIANTTEEIVKEAKQMYGLLGEQFYVKIPVSRAGLPAIKSLAEEGIPVTATAIFTPIQGILAAKAGARYLAPYVNKIGAFGGDGIQVACTIQDAVLAQGFNCKVLGASFKTEWQVVQLIAYGIDAVTVNGETMESLIANPTVESVVDGFQKEFEAQNGEGATMFIKKEWQ